MNSASLRTLSILFAWLSLIATIYINMQLATQYKLSDGKTQALFGLVEILQFGDKYWFLVPATLSLGLVFWIIKRKAFTLWDAVTIIVSLLAIAGIVTSSWKILLWLEKA